MKNIVSIILIILAIIVFAAFTNPRFEMIKELGVEDDRFDEALKKSKDLIALRDALLSRYNAIPTEAIKRVSTLLPDSIDTVRLIIDIDQLASRYGMSLGNITIGTPDSSEQSGALGPSADPYGRLSLTFNVAATYDRFRAFLNDLERSLRLIDVTALTFGEPNDAGLTMYSVTLTTYWLK